MGAPSGGVSRTTAGTGGGSNNSNNNNNSKNNGEYQANLKPAAFSAADLDAYATTTVTTNCDTYLSLIQQYIAVFEVDNALFLAERCIADYPNCYEAIYMQALCYYRLHKFKNARACLNAKQHTILQQQQVQMLQQEYVSTSKVAPTASSSVNNNYSTICSMLYLSALCSYELGDYAAAETTLIQTTRNVFQQLNASTNSSNGLSMDEWILQSTVRNLLVICSLY